MNHLSDEDLVLQYYGEQAAEAAHLACCELCAARFGELQRVLNSLDEGTVPERGDAYGAEVWQRVKPRLPGGRPHRAAWRTWGAIAALLAVGAGGFWMGRKTTHKLPVDTGVRERILLVALTDHLERSRMVLAEIENSNESLDMSFERTQAEDLLDANRLYRLTAAANGNLAAASLLDDLERVLLDIAHSPEKVGRSEMDALRERIEDQGLTFKVKVFSTGLTDQKQGKL